ncbi:MAG: hypothetical protein Ct9H300mP28_29470 [Pseudomonadota bacterium]|nr:MAG: hypothetical protein Ct9H300mP28_29470 [Pseudomonadota bacterium]
MPPQNFPLRTVKLPGFENPGCFTPSNGGMKFLSGIQQVHPNFTAAVHSRSMPYVLPDVLLL